MYIWACDGKSIVDTRFVERFCIVEKLDACLIVASYSADRAVTIGRYADRKEADAAFGCLFKALGEQGDEGTFTMPDSIRCYGEKRRRDARVARKGGS